MKRALHTPFLPFTHFIEKQSGHESAMRRVVPTTSLELLVDEQCFYLQEGIDQEKKCFLERPQSITSTLFLSLQSPILYPQTFDSIIMNIKLLIQVSFQLYFPANASVSKYVFVFPPRFKFETHPRKFFQTSSRLNTVMPIPIETDPQICFYY